MKVAVALLILLFVCSSAFAQKRDPRIRRETSTYAKGSAYKSVNSDAVAAALKKKTSPANELAKIERQNAVHQSHTVSSSTPAIPKNTTTSKSKPIHFTYKAPKKPH